MYFLRPAFCSCLFLRRGKHMQLSYSFPTWDTMTPPLCIFLHRLHAIACPVGPLMVLWNPLIEPW